MNLGPQSDHRPSEQTFHALFPRLDRRDLWSLAWLALVIRLVFLLLGLQTQDVTGVSMWADDTQTYMSVAEYWLNGDAVGKQKMLITGPGYGMILAGLQLVFGTDSWPPLCLNLAFGVLAPLVVYMLAMLLLQRRRVALLAGIISCISWTGVSLSVSQLTDQPFFTLHASALLLFVIGLKTERTRWFVAAGVVAGIATYIRAMGQVWPIVFAVMAIVFALTQSRPGRWRTCTRALMTSAILLLFILGWSYYNSRAYGVFTFTSNGVRAAASYLGAHALAMNTPGLDAETAQRQLGAKIVAGIGPENQAEVVKYLNARRVFMQLVHDHPGWLVKSYLYIIWENIQASNYQIYRQIPQFKPVLEIMTRQARDVFNEWIFFASLAGLFMLMRDRRHLAWAVLGPTFLAFTALLGFSFWQGSRLHYPAEMAWSILMAYALVRFVEWLIPKVQRYLARRQAIVT